MQSASKERFRLRGSMGVPFLVVKTRLWPVPLPAVARSLLVGDLLGALSTECGHELGRQGHATS
ncbi:hypothetical protein AB0D12_20135 [Streptomyces sp. NPDC048479]|uniref:hypothetical protein n=1 Tax=Streptomyces sp. NPDC048479 TaxID=3154725 RepID=UPI0034213BEB